MKEFLYVKADKMEKGGIRIIEPQKIIENEKKFFVSLCVYLLVIKKTYNSWMTESNKTTDGVFLLVFVFNSFWNCVLLKIGFSPCIMHYLSISYNLYIDGSKICPVFDLHYKLRKLSSTRMQSSGNVVGLNPQILFGMNC